MNHAMELRQLKYFVGIADTGNFSDTSKLLFISQSALSQQIKSLEEELGTRLFTRSTHSVVLTESGQQLLPLARRVLHDVKDCEECISDLKGLLRGELSIGLTFSLEPFVRETMISFMKQYPHMQVNAYYRNLPDLLQRIRNHEIDVMLSMMPTSAHDFLSSTPLLRYRIGAVMRQSHPLAKRPSISFKDLQPHPLILPERGIRERNAIESYIHTSTGTLHIRSLVNDVNAIINILQQANYVSILAEHTICSHPSLCFVPIEELSEPIQVYAHTHREAAPKHSIEVFLQMLRQTPIYYTHCL